jgi:multiple sugar transport system permease protein
MPVVVFAVVWRFMFHPYGLMNVGLGTLGIPPVNWLLDTKAVIPGIIFASEWRFVPFFMILYLTGLQNIPPEYYEAASLDGASKWQTFRFITLPLLKPTMLLVIVVSIITMSKVFTLALVLTEGGPNGATRVVPMFIYENGFQYFKMGRASAASIFLLLALMVVTLAQLRIFREERT